jgi:ribonuclease HII
MKTFTIGIDEVGRGALAGPVVVAAAAVKCRVSRISFQDGKGNWRALDLKDSKKLSAKQREVWFNYFKSHAKISFAVASVYPRQIERRNISRAANLAARRAYQKLSRRLPFMARDSRVFLDGGLFLGNPKRQPPQAKTVVKCDEKIRAVAIASIIAKVTRDRAMVRLAKRHPNYGFDVHKGYGTKRHQAAITFYGPCLAHRKTFLRQ